MKTKEILKYFNKEKNKYSPISGEQIGQGGQGSIRLVQDNNGNKFALKVPNKSINKDKNEYRRAKQEVLTVSEINHKNIVNIIQFEEIVPSPSDPQKGLISYLMPLYRSDLRKYLENLNTRPLHFSDPEYFLRIECQLKIIRDVLGGLKYIHDRDIIHRDLKPENILIEDTGLAVITDFGISHFPGSNLTQQKDLLANRSYLAPEQKRESFEEITKKVDIYSAGLIINEILTGRNPAGTNYIKIADVHPVLYRVDTIVEKMISFNPNDRPTIEFIVFWIDEILNELEDIENNYNLNISEPSLRNQAISDMYLADHLINFKENLDRKDLNINYHCNIHWSISNYSQKIIIADYIYEYCLNKLLYECNGSLHKENFDFNPSELEIAQQLEEFNNICKKYENMENTRTLKRAKDIFSRCKDYHRKELLEKLQSDDFTKLISDISDSPIIHLAKEYGKYFGKESPAGSFKDNVLVLKEESSTTIEDFAVHLYEDLYKSVTSERFIRNLKISNILYHNHLSYQRVDLLFDSTKYNSFEKEIAEWSISNSENKDKPYLNEDVNDILKKSTSIGGSTLLSINNSFDYNIIAKFFDVYSTSLSRKE